MNCFALIITKDKAVLYTLHLCASEEEFRYECAVTPCSAELSTLMREVPYVTDVQAVPCVWEINKFLKPFLRTIHDFANVHHFWLHKNIEGIPN